MGAALLLALLGSTVFYTNRLALERETAQRERDIATATRDYLVDVFETAQPEYALGGSVTAKDMLDRGRALLASRAEQQPALRSELFLLLGRVYDSLGEFEESRGLLEQALAIQLAQPVPDLSAQTRIRLQLAKAIADQDIDASAELLAQVMEHRSLLPIALQTEALLTRASVANDRGQMDAALKLTEQAIAEAQASGEAELVLDYQGLLGLALLSVGRLDDARTVLETNIADLERLRDRLDPGLLWTRGVLAQVDFMDGRYRESADTLKVVVDDTAAVYGDDNQITLNALLNYATTLRMGRFFDELAVPAERAAALYGSKYPDSLGYPNALQNLSSLKDHQGDVEGAIALARQAADVVKQQLGVDHYRYGIMLQGVAVLLANSGRFDEAVAIGAQGLAVQVAALGPTHRIVLDSHANQGVRLSMAGQGDAARAHAERTLALVREAGVAASPRGPALLLKVAGGFRAGQDFARAGALLDEAQTVMDAHPKETAGLRDRLASARERLQREAASNLE